MLRSIVVIGLAGLMSLTCLAQSDASASNGKSSQTESNGSKPFFQLHFVVEEVENEHVINSRSYSMIMSEMEASEIRAGEKVPFSSGASTQWQQINVGVDIDCKGLQITANGAALNVKADISSVVESKGANSPPGSLPIIRNNQWQSRVVLPLKQPSVLFSSDDPASKRTMQLKLTITPIR